MKVNMNLVRNIAAAIMVALALAMLFGCAATLPAQVKVPVPVACRETEPVRPVMPTDVLLPGSSLDRFVQASAAEIERREGYEVLLVTALRACITPIDSPVGQIAP